MSDTLAQCPTCNSEYGYLVHTTVYACPECAHEWNVEDAVDTSETSIQDMHGNVLVDGDTVIIMKDLPVKGAQSGLKAGTKVKNIRLTDGDHNIDCKIPGFGAMALKSEFVKKA